MQDKLAADVLLSGGPICVAVSGEERQLEEHHAAVPDHRRATENRQHHLGHHRLRGKRKECAEEERRCEQRDQCGRARRARNGAGVSERCGVGRERVLEGELRLQPEIGRIHLVTGPGRLLCG